MVCGVDSKLHIFVLNMALLSSSEHGVNDNIMSVTKRCVQNTSSISLTNVRFGIFISGESKRFY